MLSSCLLRVEKSGYIFEDYDQNNIVKEVTSKATILQNMGNPTFQSNFSEESYWFYLAEDNRHFLFLKPKPVKRRLLIIGFDDNDLVKDLRNLELSDANKKYNFHPKATAVKDHNGSFFKEIFGNIGTVKPM